MKKDKAETKPKEELQITCMTCNNGKIIYSTVLQENICTNEFCRFNSERAKQARAKGETII